MKIPEFVEQMERVLNKVREESGLSWEWLLVSGDPDCVADFGCDYEGNFCIGGEAFPLKIKDMTGIRYRWCEENDGEDSFLRFDFGDQKYVDYHFAAYEVSCLYCVKHNNTYDAYISKDRAIARLNEVHYG